MDGSLTELAANVSAESVGKLLSGGKLHLLDEADIVLAELLFSSPAFRPPMDGSMKSYPLAPEENAKADGRAVRFVALSRGGEPVLYGSAGTGSGSTLQLNTVEIRKGAKVSIDEFFYTARKL